MQCDHFPNQAVVGALKTLRDLRREKGKTQTDVGQAIGADKATVCAWEKAKASPWPRFIPLLAAYFEVHAEVIRHAIEETQRRAKAEAAA